MTSKEAIKKLAEQSQSATEQAAETLRWTTEAIADRITQLRRRLGLEPRRQSHADLKAVR